jgi:hypothetical protein
MWGVGDHDFQQPFAVAQADRPLADLLAKGEVETWLYQEMSQSGERGR